MNIEKQQKIDSLNEQRYKPDNYVEIFKDDELGIVVWGSGDGKSAIGYKGRAKRRDFFYKFPSIERRTEFITEFVKKIKKQAEENAQIKLARKSKKRDLVIGDILVSYWGYNQSNVDYYQVVEMVGNNSVCLREIGKQKTFESDGLSGHCIPVVDHFTGESFTKRVYDGMRVRLNSFSSARKKEYEVVDGSKVFKPDFWSAWA